MTAGRSSLAPGTSLGVGVAVYRRHLAKLMAIIAVAPTMEPEDRSMPPQMITCVTPMAMMPDDRHLQDDDLQARFVEDP